MRDATHDRLRLELRIGKILGRSMVGKLKPLSDPTDRPIARQDGDVILGGGRIRRYFDGAIISVGGGSELTRKLQRMADDGCSTLYDEAGNVLSRTTRYR